MPPKKEVEIDLSTLPPWHALIASIRFECSKSRADKLTELITTQPRSFQRTVSRDDLIAYAKDKGLYVDPNQLTDKQKKDPKALAEISTELTPNVLAKALNMLVNDINLQGRKAKKDLIDGKNNPPPPDPKKADPKKEAKKGADKKDSKLPIQAEVIQEEKPPEKEYTKNFDQLFIVLDFPSNQEETQAIYNNGQILNLIMVVKEKVVNWGGVDMGLLDQPGDFEGDLKERMEEFVEGEEEEQPELQQEQKKPIQRGMSPRSKEYVAGQKLIIGNIKMARQKSERTNIMRNLVIKEVPLELDLDIEEETLKGFPEAAIEEFCAFSLDATQFNEWIANKKQVLLITKEAPKDPFMQEMEKLQKEQKRIEQERQQEALQQQQQEAAQKGKGAKKEVKKSEEELQKERLAQEEKKKEEEAKANQLIQQMEQQKKQREKMHMQYYKKQLGNVELQKVGGGIILEVLLDQLEAEKEQNASGQVPVSLADQEDNHRIESILELLDRVVQSNAPSSVLGNKDSTTSENKSTPFKMVIDEADSIEKRAFNVKLNDDQLIPQRERKILSNMCFPGIDRFQMPEIAEKSELLRKAEKAKLLPFVSVDFYEFERRQTLLRFEELFKESEGEHEWFFGDREFVERHNRNTLSQTFNQVLLFDPHILTRYNEKDDQLLVACYFKNPPGRTLRRKWASEWRVLPNLENYISFFKNSEQNLKNELYYDLDYQQIGSLNERAKVLYPSDNSIIQCLKYTLGDQELIRYKIVKESVVFGIQEEGVFWANFDDGVRMTVQYSENASVNLTLQCGLVVRLLANGDVVQKYLEQPNVKNQENNQTSLLHLYDNAEMNHESEVRRIVTGQGSVIKQMKDGSIIILYANGNIEMQQRNDVWVTTNNRGLRKARRKDGGEWSLEAVPCAIKTDPESGSKVYIRDDQTMVIKYPDGSQYTCHRDGTKMLVSAGQDSVIVEHESFCTVRVSLDRVKARTDTIIGLGSAYANVGFENVFERSNDGRVVETFLGNGSRVISYREKQELPGYKQYKLNTINLYYAYDGGVVKVVDDGEVVLVTGPERVQLNIKGENRPDGKDIDYWLQLFSVQEERKSGVFTANLTNRTISTRDDESNFFSISANGQVVSHISVSLNANNNSDEPPQSPDIPDGDFIEEENKFLPPPKSWVHPRLFLINNNNTGQEYLSQQQLAYYHRLKNNDPLCTQVIDNAVPGIPNCTSISYITQLVPSLRTSSMIKVHLPQTLDIVPKTLRKSQIPTQKVFLFRNLLKLSIFDKEARAKHHQDLEKYEVWRKDVAKTQSEFGVIQKSEQEKDAEFNIQLRILESRKTDYSSESYDQCKELQQQRLQDASADQTVLLKSELDPLTKTKVKQNDSQNVQQALVDLQKKAQTSKIIQSKKKEKNEENTWLSGFATHYFETLEGKRALKTMPPETFQPPPKARQRVLNEEEYTKTLSQPGNKVEQQLQQSAAPVDDQPVIALENPPLQSQKLKPIIIKPSIFTQQDIDDEVRERKKLEDALNYRSQKRKEHNVYGQERGQIKQVPCLLKTNPKSELNQKYILTDSVTDNRMRISSMATRVYHQAPSISDLRNEGMHQTIIKTLDKKNQIDDLVDKKNLMISGDLNDKLRKDLTIIPIAARFGTLKQGGHYELIIQVKNEDILAQRVVVKQPKTKFAKAFLKQMGPISLGLIRKVYVQLEAQAEIIGSFADEFQLMSKHQIYTIPISAQILESGEFNRISQEYRKTHKKNLQKAYVKDIRQEVQKEQEELMDSQNSEFLPKLNYDKNFKIDPYSNKQGKKDPNHDQSQEEEP